MRADLNGLKDTVTKFISQVSSEAAKSAREVTSSVADQVGGVATDYAGKGAEMTSAASEQAKTIDRNVLMGFPAVAHAGIKIGITSRLQISYFAALASGGTAAPGRGKRLGTKLTRMY